MKAAIAILLIVVFYGLLTQSQTPTTGKAIASGNCGVTSHSGNNDVFNISINNCGIGEEQGKKIISLLKEFAHDNNLLEKIYSAVYVSPEDDVYKNLHGDLSFPTNRDLRSVEFLVTNYSSHPVKIKQVYCNLKSAVFGSNSAFKMTNSSFEASGPQGGISLEIGGDAQDWKCDLFHVIEPLPLAKCADVAISVQYIVEQNEPVTKEFRFALSPGDSKWHHTAIANPPLQCGSQ
jgi:hypothetical protein